MNQRQLRPLLHYGLSLVFEQDVFICNKYRKNTVRSFTLKDPQLKTPRLNKVTSKSKVLNTVKKLKFIKAAKLKDSSLLTNDSLKPARMLTLVKNMRTVESLCIKEVLSEKLPISLDIWLRNAKGVKSVTCLSVREINPLKLKLEKKVRKLFLWINRLKLKSLNIQATQIPGKNISPFIFQKYPSSLEEFSLSCALWEFYLPTEPKIPVDLNNSLNNLTKLKTLHFGIEDSKGVMVLLLNSIVDLSQLETLDLGFEDRKTCPIPNLLPFLSTLGQSNSIRRLRLSFASPPDNLETIFHSVNVGSLKEFEFFGALNSKSHWTLLSRVISGLDSLESLKLVLSNPNLKTQDLDLQKFPADLWLAVTKLLKKSIPLQALTLEFSDQNSLRYNQILRLLKDTASSLRLLHINLGNYYPSKPDFHQTVELLKELKQIENLDLSSVGIPGEQCFKDIVEWCYTSRNLRLLSLGKVEAIESNELFAGLVEKVITKRGIEYFSCSAAESFKMSFDKANKDIPYINLKEAKLKNPALEHYPKFIITKSRGPIEFLVQKYEDWDRKPKLKYL